MANLIERSLSVERDGKHPHLIVSLLFQSETEPLFSLDEAAPPNLRGPTCLE
jgi:hypothetical protein